jgi:hypothetical protein
VRSHLLSALVGAVVAVVVVGGVAWATIPPVPGGVIQGCYDSGGNVKVVDALPCPAKYTPFQWNQQGPAGTNGTNGTDGTNGTNGVSGYETVEGDARALSNGDIRRIPVTCPDGKKVLSGGWQGDSGLGVEVGSRTEFDGQVYAEFVRNTGTSATDTLNAQAWAICATVG